jgi:hypothetical protein
MDRAVAEGGSDMTWVVVVLLVIGVLVLAALVVRTRGARDRSEALDPMFATGIALAGAGAATTATLGPVMVAVLAVGVALMAISLARSRPSR